MAHEPTQGATATLEQLQITLEVALGIVLELAGDDQLRRLIAVFRAMPTQDRPIILDVLEREVTGRVLARATEKAIGQSTHPNPNARLYVRAHDSGFDRRLYDRDEMMIADIRGLRVACLIRNVPEIYAIWKDAMREAMDHVDEATRTIAEQLLHDVLGCISEARAAARTEDSAETPPDTRKRTRS
jgi:hypothetical protein